MRSNGLQKQQKRYEGDLPVKSNEFIEQLGYRRENIEREFVWDRKTLTKVFVFVGLVPYTIYHLAVKELHLSDEIAGRPPRKFMGSPSPSQ